MSKYDRNYFIGFMIFAVLAVGISFYKRWTPFQVLNRISELEEKLNKADNNNDD